MVLNQADKGPLEVGAVQFVDAPSQSARTSGYEDTSEAAGTVGPTGKGPLDKS